MLWEPVQLKRRYHPLLTASLNCRLDAHEGFCELVPEENFSETITEGDTKMTTTPKFSITGNTIEEMAVSFAELVLRTGSVEVVKKEKSTFGAWRLDDGTSEGFYKSLTLDADQSKSLNTPAGAPLSLAIDVRFLQLTPMAEVEKTKQQRKAATIQRLTTRLASVDDLKAKLARLQS